jgi:hypothetical protein
LWMCYSVIKGLKFLMPSHSLSPRRGGVNKLIKNSFEIVKGHGWHGCPLAVASVWKVTDPPQFSGGE